MTLPTIITSEGLAPQSPADLRQQLVDGAVALSPGLTTELPGSLIEDIASTDVGALVVMDQARVDTVDSLTPFASNDPLTIQLGNLYGVPRGLGFNTSVDVVFSGTPGFVIAQGFVVSDGTHQYIVQTGGIINTGGVSPALFAVAANAGSWAVPANSVNQLATSVPNGIALSVTNPNTGTPSSETQSMENYRAQVLQAGQAIATGMATMLKKLLGNVAGVQPRLISVKQQSNGWEVIVGGGDPYEVAYAIFRAVFYIPGLVGSTLAVTNITQGNPGVVTTDKNHGFATGQVIQMTGVVGMTNVNGVNYTITVTGPKTFSLGASTAGFPAYVSGGVVTPNLRNQMVSINDFPDVYQITYVEPPQQLVTISVTWNTISPNFVSPAAMSQAIIPAMIAYVNSIDATQPMNVFQMDRVVQAATANIVDNALLTRLVFAVSIDGVGVSPTPGTGIIAGDPEGYFFTTDADITAVQG